LGKTSKVFLLVAVLLIVSAGTAVAAVKIGTSKADTMKGGTSSDALYGLGGGDTVLGREGNDEISGYTGNDKLSGGDGTDIMIGGPGVDIIDTGSNEATAINDVRADFVHMLDDQADTACVRSGAISWYIDSSDTVLGGAECEQTLFPSASATETRAADSAEEGVSGSALVSPS
jgi:Ca2+-binding RTX toxin-like protein